jgi:hypothetical protein
VAANGTFAFCANFMAFFKEYKEIEEKYYITRGHMAKVS